ncbi:3-isopropylmalate dehydratase small subunit [Arthrobacter crystallopoietes]|uniref:3-isopropylmalate dehydratase small subunit n=1 Tax=Crystallibacter crystallopoietes TaxID=37928 RepID=A0A1H1I0I3_9MICC|nr:3-isopropylmalate dehydratase small subunit [Arthrobacter crystallopoietes]AUI53751.1 3-isopropylmalate dehydratase small subunit [Arthrobacter crystallopoietes]SDR31204.1 3-isopropylmalate dehydratase, small subunit [Arthrobacter crystallopoietes]
MEPITTVSGRVMPLDRDDVDTDQIMPKQFLTRVERTGYGEFVFHEWRREQDFVFNDPRFSGATILVAGRNFGSGSSREHAVWGLQQHGFKAVIAPSFSDIFVGNCIQTGLVPVQTDPETCRTLRQIAEDAPETEVIVDLQATEVRWPRGAASFEIDLQSREALMLGLDDVTLILHELDRIRDHEAGRPAWMPHVDRATAQ